MSFSTEQLMRMPEYIDNAEEISPDTNLRDMPGHMFNEICKHMDIDQGLVQKLIATQDGSHYQLNDIQIHECLNAIGSKCERILSMWGTLGMTVQELIIPLNILRQERSLMMLVDPIPLVLVTDIPENIERDEGETLQLQCSAEGFPYPRYTWFRNKKQVTRNQVGILEIKNIKLNDTGTYICRIHNNKTPPDVLWTSKCEVYVKESLCRPLKDLHITSPSHNGYREYPKSIHFRKQPPEEIKVMHGQPLELTLEAFGAPPLRYMWCLNGEILTEGQEDPRLQIKAVSNEHVGEYQCTVSNDGSTDTKSNKCRIIVVHQISRSCTTMPVICRQPTNKEECIQGMAMFVVEAQCLQKLSYQWYHNGTPRPGWTSNELRFSVDKYEQAGEYQCQITTCPESGTPVTIMSKTANLTINKSRKGITYCATDKLAILLGQSSYRSNHPMLPAVKNDMYIAYEVFTKMGYKTISCLDNTLEEMNMTIDIAIDMMKCESNNQLYVVLYLVGHGFYRDGITYLMPCSAQEGTQVSNCLSFDEVEKRITRELDPELFFIISDVCQKEMNHVLQDTIPARCPDPYSKKKVVIRAATLGEESLEETLNSNKCISKNKSAVIEVPGWTDITVHRKFRGIFSKTLFDVLDKSDRLLIHDLYKAFNIEFTRNRVDPTTPDAEVKEQNPVFEINLEADRSLFDPINPDGQEKTYEKRKEHYDLISKVPTDFNINLHQLECWNIRGSFKAKASNVLELIMYEEDRRPPNHPLNCIQVTYNISAQSVPVQARPTEFYTYDDDKVHCVKQKRGYIFYNLQQLQQPLQMILEIQYSGQSSPYLYAIVPGFTLISQQWNLSELSPYTPRPSSYSREACEHSEGDDKLSSMESYA